MEIILHQFHSVVHKPALFHFPLFVSHVDTRLRETNRWAGHVERIGQERGVYRVLVGKPEGRRPLGRPRHRWVDNIRTDLREMGCGYMD